jgi:hypothetical protein
MATRERKLRRADYDRQTGHLRLQFTDGTTQNIAALCEAKAVAAIQVYNPDFNPQP